jgi:hypothetical protein
MEGFADFGDEDTFGQFLQSQTPDFNPLRRPAYLSARLNLSRSRLKIVLVQRLGKWHDPIA